jgi:hypothetical protein
MRIIGFTGGMGVGKSTAISILNETFHDRPVFLVKFAQPLYDMQEYIYTRIDKVVKRSEDFKKDRKLLQWLGTDWGRDTIKQDLWVAIWKAEVESIFEDYDDAVVVCDDVRFDNEAEAIKSLGGHIIKLVRDNNTLHAEGGEGFKKHQSEAGISENFLDFTIHNSDTVTAFRNKLVACFLELYQPSL